jgi:HD superfamily phosphohydrolase
MSAHEQFREALEDWGENLLRPYIDHLGSDGASRSSKEFNDPVWRTIVLRPIEVAVLDSPLLQRLRFIRQLGLVHLVYPAAQHTRLEHSIGVVTQIDRLIESVNRHFSIQAVGGEDPGQAINKGLAHVLRLTALCHDVGHGAMSHVSENAVSLYPECAAIRQGFDDEIGGEGTALSEIASFYLVGSPAFGDLIETAARATAEPVSPGAIEQMQNLIIGKMIDDTLPLLQEFISGPFDGDKLDYMTRDAMMSGVPIVTDTERLVQKIRAVRVPAEKLPPEIKEKVGEHDYYVMTGIAMSGARAIDELMFGRVLLHDKLYRHHKVRAAEAMVASALRLVAPMLAEGPALAPFRLEDHQLLELRRADVRSLAGRKLSPRECRAADAAVKLMAMLRRRELFVRAFAFALDMPGDAYHAEPEHFDGLSDIVANSEEPEFLDDLVARIAQELTRICERLAPDLIEEHPGGFEPFVALDPPKPPPDDTDAAHAYLISEGREGSRIHPARPGIAGASRWSEAYLLTRETGYVFTTRQLGPYVYLASEVVLRRDHGIRIPRAMLDYAKQEQPEIDENKRRLAELDYFRGLPSDLAPLPKALRSPAAKDRITKILENLQGYEGPRGSRTDKGLPLLSRERVFDWLKQFGSQFGEEPLKLLEGLRMVGRPEVLGALEAFFAQNTGQFSDASICPLGTAKDSSAITTYYAGDLRGYQVLSVPEALAREEPIVFIDDFVGRGHQAISILEAWFDEPSTTNLGEERGEPLSGALQAGLRERPLGFVFASGRPDGVDALEKAIERIELNATVSLHSDPLAPRAFSGRGNSARDALEARCREIGDQLLDDDEPRHNQEWRKDRSLGYGNEAFLVVFPYNTPSQTLTCIWRSGTVDGVEWTALLPRRQKL